ncbi:MAG: hypothetical protein JKY52_20610 [Flavobacteriales bacterium]|nr:hypothetical protein [Flavobacteriales bacterium]
MNKIKSVTEWKYAVDSNGTQYASMKQKSNLYNRAGDLTEYINHQGLYTVNEERAIYQYNEAGELVKWAYYIDTNAIKTAHYEYDSLSRRIKETRKHKHDSTYVIYYSSTIDQVTGERVLISICDVCFKVKSVLEYDKTDKLVYAAHYNKGDTLISEVKLFYNKASNLIKEETIWSFKCDECIDKTIIYEYDSEEHLISETHSTNQHNIERKFIYTYDSSGINSRVLRTIWGNDNTLVSDYKYEYYN